MLFLQGGMERDKKNPYLFIKQNIVKKEKGRSKETYIEHLQEQLGSFSYPAVCFSQVCMIQPKNQPIKQNLPWTELSSLRVPKVGQKGVRSNVLGICGDSMPVVNKKLKFRKWPIYGSTISQLADLTSVP